MTIAADPAVSLPSERNSNSTPMSQQRLDASLVSAPSVEVAQSLLGTLLVRDDEAGRRVARIVETEAYAGPEDRASHARAGRTARTNVIYGPPGHAYVYLVYGMHHCLNVVCAATGEANAVLIRAIEPIDGIDVMRSRRGRAAGTDERLGAGPARLCQALDIDRDLDGIDLLHDERLWLAAAPSAAGDDDPPSMVLGPRVGVDYAGPDWASRLWRFGIAGHASLSRPFPPSG